MQASGLVRASCSLRSVAIEAGSLSNVQGHMTYAIRLQAIIPASPKLVDDIAQLVTHFNR